jgi:tRNA threonylcarbamoyladenosine biosynthesis protein TsaE
LADEAATLALGAALAPALRPGLVIHLCGDLGAGKTTLVRGLLRALGYAGAVRSPTYTLVELYAISRLDLYHFDFYRFRQAEEYLDAGLDEYFTGNGVCLVEWPEKAGTYCTRSDLRVDLVLDGSQRRATVQAISARGLECLNVLSASLKPPGSP